jgi:Domain of unknown function (DUF4389)
MQADTPPQFPATLEIDYPDRQLNRLTTFFRPFAIIPIAAILALVTGPAAPQGSAIFILGAGGVILFPTVLMILFRQKYPRWWFDWNLALTRFSTRCSAYLALLRDEYPSTDEEQCVHIEIPYPDAKHDLSSGMPLIKWFLAIPHFVLLWFLAIAAIVCVIIAWFAILFTGRYPKALFNFVVGVLRWSLRVAAYALLLTTDQYPPFSLE